MLKALGIIILLGVAIFALMAILKTKSGSSIIIPKLQVTGSGSSNVGTGGSGSGSITPATPKPELKSRFTNIPKSLGGNNIDASGDFNFGDPNEGKSLFCKVTNLC